ncbi:MAG: hypothetical protein COW88_02175 [Candidatus Lloydbacteria bacterium CG22_combo_CG10-13_8_21_14_all_47_15]|uniref:TraC-like domain-containing protein n=1 Tax=Candidatus Lloydbacteria bacterium CG22_combo_CG10-13_8_21_14_all_47_15 TaxID=1974635 RepID=A0A2H0CTZ2_9BACT|nr:MAG: hypothetical protein COW88_02175 [Candidatus Lloydbacteria bacterium CG22_combo_CG10-13_8_21_14_all_47_15]
MADKTTQQFVPVKEVRDGVVVLKNGSLRMVLMASSLNFALKSTDEQQAIILQFQNFLNSLDFSVEFYIQSRRLDIRPYIALLEGRQKEQVNDLIKIQTREYVAFIKNFTESVDIMTKSFFIVIPYERSVAVKQAGFQKLFPGAGKKSKTPQMAAADIFEESRTQLEQRAGVVEQGLIRSGVRVVPLGTEEIIELFYQIFNPGELEKPITAT